MTVTLDELAQDERRQHRFLGTATLGEGTKKVLGVHADRDTAMQIAEQKALKAERALAAVEVHDPNGVQLTAGEGMRMLKDPAGVLVEVPQTVVAALLEVGYQPADEPAADPFTGAPSAPLPLSSGRAVAEPQVHPLEGSTDEPAPRRRPGRPKQQQPDD